MKNDKTPVRMGIIGYGGMARYHADRWRKTGLLQTVGVYDTDPLQQKAAQEKGYIAYASAEELLADKTIEGVLIATPNDFHRPYAIQAANAGKHILCEKPVALSCAELDEMESAAKRNGVVLTVHQNRRWDDDYVAARQIADSGVLGKIYRIDSFVCGANGIPGGWRKIKAQGGGMMLDWGVHLLDQIFHWLPSSPSSLYCRYSHALGFDVDDGFDAQLGYADGLTVNVRVDTNTYSRMPRWTLYGRDGTAQIADWDLRGHITLPVYGKEAEIVGIEAGNGFTKTMAYRPHDSVEQKPIPRPAVDHDAFFANFASACRGEQPPAVDLIGVRKVMRCMELCVLSHETNTVLKNELHTL